MKKVLPLLVSLFMTSAVFCAPKVSANQKVVLEAPAFNEPNSFVFDLQNAKIRDKIIVSDFSNDPNVMLTVYLWDGTEWVLATRYKPATVTQNSTKIYFSTFSALAATVENEEMKKNNATEVHSYFSGNLGKYAFAAVTISNPSVNVEYGAYKNDLYFVLSKTVNPKTSVAGATLVNTESVEGYKTYTTSDGKKATRTSIDKVQVLNISKNADFCFLVYGKAKDSDKFDYYGLTYFYKIGQQEQLNTMGRNLINAETLYFVSDNGVKQNVKVVFKGSTLFLIVE